MTRMVTERIGCGQVIRDFGFEKINFTNPEFEGGIYMRKEEVEYIISKHETLIDSLGNGHDVQISYSSGHKMIIDESKLEFRIVDGRLFQKYGNYPFEFYIYYHQRNIKKYVFIYLENITKYTLKDSVDKICGIYNDLPQFFSAAGYKLEYAFERSGYYPFFEFCGSGDYNYIPDKMFFNYPDRAVAVKRCCYYKICEQGNHALSNKTFDNIDYINMSEAELIIFMNDRFKKRLKFEQYLKSN